MVEPKSSLVLDELPCVLATSTRRVAQPINVGGIILADLQRVLLHDRLTEDCRGEGILLTDGIAILRNGGVESVIIEDRTGGMLRGAAWSRRQILWKLEGV